MSRSNAELAGRGAWLVLLLCVGVFALFSVKLLSDVSASRAELSASVGRLIDLANAAPERLPEVVARVESELRGKRVLPVAPEEANEARRKLQSEIRIRNAEISTDLGASWDSMTGVVFSALAFALLALILAALGVRNLERTAEISQALGKELARAEAAERLAKLNEELRVAAEKAVEAGRVHEQLLLVLGHEFRTPVTAIRGYAEMLVEDGESDAEAIVEASLRLEQRMAQVLDLAEGVQGQNLALPFAVEEVLVDVAGEFGLKVQGHARAVGDPERLRRAVREVLQNAVTYGECPQISTTVLGDEVKVLVVDEGEGMTAEALREAPRAFWQGNARQSRPGGLGVGLALVQHHLSVMGGRLEMESQLGVGTRVSLLLPAEPD